MYISSIELPTRAYNFKNRALVLSGWKLQLFAICFKQMVVHKWFTGLSSMITSTKVQFTTENHSNTTWNRKRSYELERICILYKVFCLFIYTTKTSSSAIFYNQSTVTASIFFFCPIWVSCRCIKNCEREIFNCIMVSSTWVMWELK